VLKYAPLLVFIALWEAAVAFFAVPRFILPAPSSVARAFMTHYDSLLYHMGITAVEIILGFFIGSLLGMVCGMVLSLSRRLETALTPFLLMMQALPVFAIAPLLVVWFGFGLAPKLIMTTIIIFFPVAMAFLNGLREGEKTYALLATHYNMNPWQRFWLLSLPFSRPSLLSGLKIGAAVAPIGAIVGEWVGSAGGLGFLMLHANARMQSDQMFAALFLLLFMVLALQSLINLALRQFSR
jgi:putative hydroxymethylpyrimidine transport system permease protein